MKITTSSLEDRLRIVEGKAVDRSAAKALQTKLDAADASAFEPDPKTIIGGELGDAIADRAAHLNAPASVLINGLLPAASSLMKIGTKIILDPGSGFIQPPIIWNLAVAESGSNKSATMEMFVKPIYELQKMSTVENRNYFTFAQTMPGVSRVQADQPDYGCLIYIDELSGFVRKLYNDQRSGRGDEQSKMLTLYDGNAQRGTYADTSRNYSFDSSSFSLLSSIQPAVLLECMGDLNDSSGLWARFNLCEIPLQRRRLSPRGQGMEVNNLRPLLDVLYAKIENLAPLHYGLDDAAYNKFADFYESMEDQRLDTTIHPAMRAYFAKQQGRCGRIALVLHIIRSLASGQIPPQEINVETMNSAVCMCEFYEKQLERFYSLSLAAMETSLDNDALLVVEVFKKRGQGCWLTPSQVRASERSFKVKGGTQRVKAAISQLVDMGKLVQDVADEKFMLAQF